MTMFMVLSSWLSHCVSSPGSSDVHTAWSSDMCLIFWDMSDTELDAASQAFDSSHASGHLAVLILHNINCYLSLALCFSPGSVTDTDTEYRDISNTDTDTEVGIPNTEKYRIPTKKYRKNDINQYFNFLNTTPSWSEFTPVLAANTARLNHFNDPYIQ